MLDALKMLDSFQFAITMIQNFDLRTLIKIHAFEQLVIILKRIHFSDASGNGDLEPFLDLGRALQGLKLDSRKLTSAMLCLL